MENKILRFSDKIIGSILYGFFYIVCKLSKPKKRGNNILAIKLWAIGESVLVLPALKTIKAEGKGRLFVLVTKQNMHVFRNLDFIDGVIKLNLNPVKMFKISRKLKKRGIGMCIDFEPYTKFSAVMAYLSGAKTRIGFGNRPKLYTKIIQADENIHAVKNFINLANGLPSLSRKIKYPEKLVPLKYSKEDEKCVTEKLKEHGIGKKDMLIGMHAGSASSSLSRRWSEEKFAELCNKLIDKYDAKIILVGSESESVINKSIINMTGNGNILNFAGEINLKELFALMKKLKLFVANDSGPMHIAAAMGTPTIGLFGPNLPEHYGPYGKRHIGLYKGNGIPSVRPFRGIFGENQEIDKIRVADVLESVKKIRAL